VANGGANTDLTLECLCCDKTLISRSRIIHTLVFVPFHSFSDNSRSDECSHPTVPTKLRKKTKRLDPKTFRYSVMHLGNILGMLSVSGSSAPDHIRYWLSS
jgi:hypothetical protein